MYLSASLWRRREPDLHSCWFQLLHRACSFLCSPNWSSDSLTSYHWYKVFGTKYIWAHWSRHIEWEEKYGLWRSCRWNIWITLITGDLHYVEILCRKMSNRRSFEFSIVHEYLGHDQFELFKSTRRTSNPQAMLSYRSPQLSGTPRWSITCITSQLFHTKWTNVSIATFYHLLPLDHNFRSAISTYCEHGAFDPAEAIRVDANSNAHASFYSHPRNHLFASVADRAIGGRGTKHTAARTAIRTWPLDSWMMWFLYPCGRLRRRTRRW
jgi:hypothetical protein